MSIFCEEVMIIPFIQVGHVIALSLESEPNGMYCYGFFENKLGVVIGMCGRNFLGNKPNEMCCQPSEMCGCDSPESKLGRTYGCDFLGCRLSAVISSRDGSAPSGGSVAGEKLLFLEEVPRPLRTDVRIEAEAAAEVCCVLELKSLELLSNGVETLRSGKDHYVGIISFGT